MINVNMLQLEPGILEDILKVVMKKLVIFVINVSMLLIPKIILKDILRVNMKE